MFAHISKKGRTVGKDDPKLSVLRKNTVTYKIKKKIYKMWLRGRIFSPNELTLIGLRGMQLTETKTNASNSSGFFGPSFLIESLILSEKKIYQKKNPVHQIC